MKKGARVEIAEMLRLGLDVASATVVLTRNIQPPRAFHLFWLISEVLTDTATRCWSAVAGKVLSS